MYKYAWEYDVLKGFALEHNTLCFFIKEKETRWWNIKEVQIDSYPILQIMFNLK